MWGSECKGVSWKPKALKKLKVVERERESEQSDFKTWVRVQDECGILITPNRTGALQGFNGICAAKLEGNTFKLDVLRVRSPSVERISE